MKTLVSSLVALAVLASFAAAPAGATFKPLNPDVVFKKKCVDC